jgi:hypothetical protein
MLAEKGQSEARRITGTTDAVQSLPFIAISWNKRFVGGAGE